jgi:hypothetical protein
MCIDPILLAASASMVLCDSSQAERPQLADSVEKVGLPKLPDH